MSSASKVGEIFTAAGQAFNRLGDLTMQLHPNVESQSGSQIRTALKKKAFEDAGLPVRQLNTVSQPSQQNVQQTLIKSEVTLNMLNAAESEVDVEGLHEEVKLEFDGANEEVSS
ncbi:chromatin complexes subunit BAP18 [Asbolus verrucosus]|uniref:Chromatin complexes subunit BAP18 n=1 Tax=Asbolus verrucosus TaxID=1661398 RepID=A0A482VV56_ASBVE|nr:chromatin complexes subunit BAP18 [Asbolus verrucosus]